MNRFNESNMHGIIRDKTMCVCRNIRIGTCSMMHLGTKASGCTQAHNSLASLTKFTVKKTFINDKFDWSKCRRYNRNDLTQHVQLNSRQKKRDTCLSSDSPEDVDQFRQPLFPLTRRRSSKAGLVLMVQEETTLEVEGNRERAGHWWGDQRIGKYNCSFIHCEKFFDLQQLRKCPGCNLVIYTILQAIVGEKWFFICNIWQR